MFGLNALGAQSLYQNTNSVQFAGISNRQVGSGNALGTGAQVTGGTSTGPTKSSDPLMQFKNDVDLNGIKNAYDSNLAYGRRGNQLDVIA